MEWSKGEKMTMIPWGHVCVERCELLADFSSCYKSSNRDADICATNVTDWSWSWMTLRQSFHTLWMDFYSSPLCSGDLDSQTFYAWRSFFKVNKSRSVSECRTTGTEQSGHFLLLILLNFHLTSAESVSWALSWALSRALSRADWILIWAKSPVWRVTPW